MLYVLVDGNNFFIKNLFAYKSGMRKSEQLFEKEEQILEYSHIITNSLFNLIERFDGVIGLVLCFDNKTWRKQYFPDYKAHREYDASVNWNAYFKFLEDYTEKIQSIHNIKISKIEGFEADDLLYLWSKKLNNSGNDCIVISEDKDLHQLVKTTSNGNFTIIYNNSYKTPKVYKDPFSNLNESSHQVDIFNASDTLSNSRTVLKWMLKEVDSIEDIDLEHFIINKILIGDKGDNVPSVWTWIDHKGKKKRITPSIAEKIVSNFLAINDKGIYYLYNDFEFFKSALVDAINFVTGLKFDVEELKKAIERNSMLMCLHHKFMPKDIIKIFQEQFEESYSGKINKAEFLKETKYFQDLRAKVGSKDKLDSFFNSFGV